MPIELTKFDKRVYEVLWEFQSNHLDCSVEEVIMCLEIPPTDRNFTKVERAFLKIRLIMKEIKKELLTVSNN